MTAPTRRSTSWGVRAATAVAVCAVVLAVGGEGLAAQDEAVVVPDLAGIWDGSTRARPINGPNQPWTRENFPVLNERGLAYQSAFDEAIAPKYDCVPSASPALQYDPYFMQVIQWPDRVVIRYEKDDQLRTVWLDGRETGGGGHDSQPFTANSRRQIISTPERRAGRAAT